MSLYKNAGGFSKSGDSRRTCNASIKLVLAVTSIFLVVIPVGGKVSMRGISPEDRAYFSTPTFACRDSSKQIPLNRLNDDFCDCADGTDEPGTSACVLGKFYCRNRGHTPASVFASRVNDGICDCCDGSDEYANITHCPHVCEKEGEASRKELKRKVKIFEQGAVLRNKLVEESATQRAAWEEEKKHLANEKLSLAEKEKQLLAEKQRIEAAEKEEREWREKLEKEQAEQDKALGEKKGMDHHKEKAQEVEAEVEEVEAEEAEAEQESPQAGVGSVGGGEGEVVGGAEESMEGLSKEEIGARIASRWTGGGGGGPATPQAPTPQVEEEEEEEEEEVEEEVQEEEGGEDMIAEKEEGEKGEEKMEAEEEDEEGVYVVSKQLVTPVASWHSSILQWPRAMCSNLLAIFSPPPPAVNKSEAERVRKEHSEAQKAVREVEKRLQEVEKHLGNDHGPEGEYLSMDGKCFSFTIDKYVYEVCPYGSATQKEGHITTRLGEWDGFYDSNWSEMQFQNGETCWNGPPRSITLHLECGLTNEMLSVDEPSRCEYAARMTTPAKCTAVEAKALQAELAQKLAEMAEQTHDEL